VEYEEEIIYEKKTQCELLKIKEHNKLVDDIIYEKNKILDFIYLKKEIIKKNFFNKIYKKTKKIKSKNIKEN